MYKLTKTKPKNKTLKQLGIVDLLIMTQGELYRYILQTVPGAIEVAGGIVIDPPMPANTTLRPMLTAHMDTVDTKPPTRSEVKTRTTGQTVYLSRKSKRKCLGADDRAGVFIILKIIASEHFDRYTYAFFEDEERGCVGSTLFTDSAEFDLLDAKTSVFIGVDRKCAPGVPEIAQYGYDNNDLEEVLEEQLPEYKLTWGTFTDCSNLSDYSKSGTPCFNITAGYSGEHTRSESLHLLSMYSTLQALSDLQIPDKEFEADPTSGHYSFRRSDWDYDYDNEGYDWLDNLEGVVAPICCDLCGSHDRLYEINDSYHHLCEACLLEERSLTVTKRSGHGRN